MSGISGKELGIAAGVAVASFVAGGLINKFLGASNTTETTLPTTDSTQKSDGHLKSSRDCDSYVSEHSLREPAMLKELRQHTEENVRRSAMLTDPAEAQFFRMILNMLDAKKCIEVGTYTGYNALSAALTIPADGMVYALDVDEEFVKEGYPFFDKAGVRDKIIVKIAPALETMDQLIKDGQGETFDFIYIDADKMNYENYLDRAMLLLRVGGIAALDNTLQGGLVLDPASASNDQRRHMAEIMHKLNKKIRLDNRFQLSFLNISDGVTLCRKI